MKNAEGKIMTIEEAREVLEQVLITLAKNAVHNKRLTEYADDLERYIAFKENEEAKATDDKKEETTVDEILDESKPESEPEAE